MEILQNEGTEGQESLVVGFLKEEIMAAREESEERIKKELQMESEAEKQTRLWSEANALARR